MKIIILTTSIIAISIVMIPSKCMARTLTMDQAISAAIESNPTLSAATHAENAARARPPQAATPPDPNFMVQFGQVPIDTIDVGKGTITYMVQQMIPFPAKLVYGYRAEKRAAEAAMSHREMTEHELKRLVKLAYLEVYRLQEEARFERQALSALRTNKRSAEQAYAAEEGTLADPLLASVNMGDVEGRLAVVEQDRLDALANLSALMAQPLVPETSVAAPSKCSPVADLGTLIERAKAIRPDIKESEHMIRSQEARVSHAKAQYGPDLTLRWGYDDRYNQQDAWTGRVMVSVPLWFASKQAQGVKESKAMLKRAKSINEERVLSTEKEIKSAFARYNAARKRAGIYANKVVPRARTYLSATKESYLAGEGSFDDVVDGVLEQEHASIELIRARVDQHRAYADLERAVGASPSMEGS